MKFITRVKFRRSTAALWTSNNPVLFEGEAGYETDTGKFKIGDGVTAWSSLAYSSGAKGDKGDTGAKGDQGIQGEAGPNQVSDATETTFGNGVLISDGAGNVALIPFTGDATKFLRDDGTMAVVSGAVSSVFGRTGAVVAVDGDYSQSKITGLKTSDSPMFTALNIGHASDTTLARVSPGVISLEGATVLVQGGALGTPLSGTLTNCTGLPAGGLSASATSRIFGRKTAGAGIGEEVTLSELLDFIGSAAQGDILYRGASGWSRLAAGTNGYFLKSQGPGANLMWDVGGAGAAVDGSNITTPANWLAKLNALDQYDIYARVIEIKGGIMFDGTTSGQRMSALIGDLSIGTGDFTCNALLRIPYTNPIASASIVAISTAQTTTAAYSFYAYIHTDGKLYVVLYGLSTSSANTYRWISTSSFVSTYTGKLVSLTFVRDAGTGYIYVNGVDVTANGSWSSGGGGASAPSNFAESIAGGWVHIGGIASVSSYPERIASVAFFGYALTASDVLLLANGGIANANKWCNYPGYNLIHSVERNSAFSKGVASDWVATGGGASISSAGAVVLGAVGESISLSRLSGYIAQMMPGALHKVSFTIASGTFSGNTVSVYWGTAVNDTTQLLGTFGANGNYSFEFTPAFAAGVLSFVAVGGASNFTLSAVKVVKLLLTNGNCETTGTGGGSNVSNNIVMYWLSVYTGTSAITQDNTTSYNGTYSIKFNRVGVSDDMGHYLASTSPNLLIPGRKYKLSFYAKGNAGGELLSVLDSATGSTYQTGITLTTSWAQYTVSFVAKGVRFGIRQNFTGTGVWWIDDIEIVEQGACFEFDAKGLDDSTALWLNNNPAGCDGVLYSLYSRGDGTYSNIVGGLSKLFKSSSANLPQLEYPGLTFLGNANQRLTCSNMANISTNDFWINIQFLCPVSNPSSSAGLFRITSSASNAAASGSVECYVSNAGHLYFSIYGATTSDYRYTLFYDFVSQFSGKRVDITINRSTTGVRFWFNGLPKIGSENVAGTVPTWQYAIVSTYCHLAAAGSLCWLGDIYKFMIGRGSLTNQQALQLCQSGISSAASTPISYGGIIGSTNGLIAAPRLTAGFGNTFPDMSGNGYAFVSNLLDERHKVFDRNLMLNYSLADRRFTCCSPSGAGGASTFGDTYTVQGTPSSSAADANQPQCTNIVSAASLNATAGYYSQAIHFVGRNPRGLFDLRLVDLTTIRIIVGLHNLTATGFNNASWAAASVAAFRFSTAEGDTNWQAITANAATATVFDTGIAADTTRILFEIEIISGLRVNFYANTKLIKVQTLTLPSSGASLRAQISLATQDTNAHNIKMINIETNS